MELINKIVQKSKLAKFEAQKEYNNKYAVVPYEEIIVANDKYPDFIFLVHKNIIFELYSLVDSSYKIFSFNRKGDFVREEDPKKLGIEFFRDMRIIKKI